MEDDELSRRRSKQEFMDWVDEWSMRRPAGISEHQSLLRRIKPEDKKMLEEAIPVQKYLRLFCSGYDDLFIELNVEKGNGPVGYDARISKKDGNTVEYLQITTVPTVDEHIDRLIVSGGYTFPAASKTEKAVTKRCYDLQEHCRHLETFADLRVYAELVIKSVERKLAKKYPEPGVLIIVLDPDMIVENEDRFETIITAIDRQKLGFGPFTRIIVMAFGTGLVKEWNSNDAKFMIT